MQTYIPETRGRAYETTMYNLDVIISVGYRVKSVNGTRFRQWANSILKQYLIKGYAVNQKRLENYNELKNIVRLMSRAITLQDQVTDGEYSGLLIAERRTEEKDVMVKVVVSLINKDNQ